MLAKRSTAAILALLGALTLTSCDALCPPLPVSGTVAPQPKPPAAPGYPVTITNCGRDYRFDQPPKRVVVTGDSVAEVSSILALGLGDRIVANTQKRESADQPDRDTAIAALPAGGIATGAGRPVPRDTMMNLKPDLVLAADNHDFSTADGAAGREQLAAVGANSYLPDPACTPAAPGANPTIDDSYTLLRDLGRIFGVSDRAERLITDSEHLVGDMSNLVAGLPPANVLLVRSVEPGGRVTAAATGVWNDVLARAGGANVVADASPGPLTTVSSRDLAATKVDAVIITGATQAGARDQAETLFARYPQWQAAKDERYLGLADSYDLGPDNAIAVDRLARLLHPGAC
ncbi:ABC transporter substrate-binding protein [Amycolatopsis sp. H6(2020)]|nr:ABC transporter substrate-binding protein [Amycolatopsis sp. H6(2020)]